MGALPLVVSVVSIVFLVVVAGVVSYFAFAGPSRDISGTSETEPSGSD